MNNTKHPELNSISYYKLNGSINDIETNLKKKTSTKYLISILKANFLNRLLTQGNEFDILHYILFKEDEIYIYPPEAYNKTIIYSTSEIIDCEENNFPECIYYFYCDYMNLLSFFYETDGYMFPIFPTSLFFGNKFPNIICLSIPFEHKINSSDFFYTPKICIEMNLTKMFSKANFKTKEAFNFYFFSIQIDDIVILYQNNIELYPEIKKVFADKKFGIYSDKQQSDVYYIEISPSGAGIFLKLIKE